MSHYLIEPYTIFQGKKKEKHWMQIAEEESLYFRMIHEQQLAQQQAESTTPPVPGGWPQSQLGYFHPDLSTLGFSVSPSSTGSAPYTVYLNCTAESDVVRFSNFTWNFSDGTSVSSGPSISKTFQTGSFKVSLTASKWIDGGTAAVVIPNVVTASLPVIVANFTSSVRSGSVPLSVTFTNLSFINQYTGSGNLPGVTYLWNFGSASATSTEANPTITYYQTGSYYVKLEDTGSYGMKSTSYKLFISAST